MLSDQRDVSEISLRRFDAAERWIFLTDSFIEFLSFWQPLLTGSIEPLQSFSHVIFIA